MDMKNPEQIGVRVDDSHWKIIQEALDGPYEFRTVSDFVRVLIERWAHERSDRLTREERDAMLVEIRELLLEMKRGNDEAVQSLQDYWRNQNTLRMVKDAFKRLGFTTDDFGKQDN